MAPGHAVDGTGQPGLRVQPVEPGRLQHGIEIDRPLAAGLGAQEQKILLRQGNGAQAAFGRVVVDADPAVPGIDQQCRPAVERILDGLGQGGLDSDFISCGG